MGIPLLACLGVLSAAADLSAPLDTEKSTTGFIRAEDSVAGFSLPPGFHAQVFAAEPDVRQPIAITTDTRGRVWVAENYTYAEQPQRWDPSQRDRIVILEDRDGDGRSDRRVVFWDQGSKLTSVEVGFGGVWALCPPQLLFIPDRNKDDKPDGPPEVVLDGFSDGKSIGHNIANGLKWGPDGWLYGRHGILDTSAVGPPGSAMAQRHPFNCAIFRYHPTQKRFEVVSHGGTNPWGLDFDQHGQMFYTNTVIGHLWHVAPGGYYRRMFGAHLNPRVYDVIEQTADHFHWNAAAEKWNDIKAGPLSSATDQRGGGHAHVGCLIYQGGAWPSDYHNALFTCNLQGNRVNVDTLHRDGCGYTAKHAPDFMRSRDTWFRGIDLITGADGNVLIADWSDTGECHDNDGIHRSSGRIYKISHGESSPVSAPDPRRYSNTELVALVRHKNDWFARSARRLLQERAAEQRPMDDAKTALSSLLDSKADVVIRLRALWCLHAIGALNQTNLRPLLEDSSEHVRVWAIRLLGDSAAELDSKSMAKLTELARTDPSGLVRLFLASLLQRIAPEKRWDIASALAAHGEDQGDRQQPLMIWYGLEPALLTDPAKAVQLAASTPLAIVRRHVARRLAEDLERAPEWINALVAAVSKTNVVECRREDVLVGLSAALRGWRSATKPAAWDALANALAQGGATETALRLERELSLLFGSGRAESELLAIIRDSGESADARRNALQSLARNPKPEYLPFFKEWAKDRTLGAQAARALARYDDPQIPTLLLTQLARLGLTVRNEAIDTLISRPEFARELLQWMEMGRLPPTLLTPYQARHIRGLGDQALNERLTRVWGETRDSPAAKREEISKWHRVLAGNALPKANTPQQANATNGRALFTQRCATCHKLHGEGGSIGPDLTGSDRRNLAYLLENIIDPGAVVPVDSQMTIVKLRDGRVLSGIVAEKTAHALTLQTPAERLQLAQSEITEIQKLPNSLMPEGLLQDLSDDQARDLFAYLMSESPSSK